MQIRTALAIGTGIAVGVIFGMGVSDDTKCRITGKIRKNLIYALGGEEKKKYTTYRNPGYCTTYAEYDKKRRVDVPDKKILEFDSLDEADKYIGKIETYIQAYKTMSVHDLASMRDIPLDYTWDSYGWTESDLISLDIEGTVVYEGGKYVIRLPKPKLLKH